MGLGSVGLWAFFIFEPIIFIVTAVPASLGGWGVQELIYQETFGEFGGMGRNEAVALSVLYSISLVLVTIPGGLLFALGATRRSAVLSPRSSVQLPPGETARATPTEDQGSTSRD